MVRRAPGAPCRTPCPSRARHDLARVNDVIPACSPDRASQELTERLAWVARASHERCAFLVDTLTSTTLALVGGGGSANGGSIDGGNSGCGCGNSYQDTCVKTL